MIIKEIKNGEEVIARHISLQNFKEGLGFYSNDEDFMQIGTWRYNSGKELLKHSHNVVPRTFSRTHEVLIIKKGSIKAFVYNLEKELIETLVVKEDEILVLLNSGHGYEILEDDTQVIEIKNGPYLGAEVDRTRF